MLRCNITAGLRRSRAERLENLAFIVYRHLTLGRPNHSMRGF